MSIEEQAENFALMQWLSDYPSDMSYDEIIEAIRADEWLDKEIYVWELIENETPDEIAYLIESTKESFYHTVNRMITAAFAA